VIRRIVRLTFRMHRFEVGAIVVLAALLVLCSIVASWALANVGLRPDCQPSFETGELPASCVAAWEAFNKIASLASPISLLTTLFPVIAGLLIGGPIMAREIERGTTSLAWSLSPSRLRWFLHRVVPMVVLLLGVSFAVGAAADHLTHALSPQIDLSASFVGFRFRGVLLATQAFLLASTAVAVGALFGRAVPTFLLSLILGMLTIVAVGLVHRQILLDEAVVQRQDENTFYSNDDLYLDNRLELPDGRLVTYEELIRIDPKAFESEFGPQYPNVALLIPGDRYRIVETREAAAELVIGLAFLVGGAFVVTRRRPT
jgi:ABC-type transport system involved in multi-copper enzyme maturation permease subunit